MKSADKPRNGSSRNRGNGKKPKKRWGWKQYSLIVLLGMGIAVGAFVVAIGAFLNLTPFDPTPLERTSEPTVVYAGDGSVYMTIQPAGAATDLSYQQIPKVLQNALVATEDHNFWHSNGLDLRGILRAAFHDIWTRSRDQGASNIEDQLAKITYLSDDKSFKYKVQQLAMGVQIDRYFSKQDILRMYLNRVFLGENTIGVAQAAERYFGVDLTKGQTLTLPQAALLAGLPQAPTGYDPLQHPQAALERRNEVLQNMAKYGYITQAKADATSKLPLGVSFHTLTQNAWDEQPLFTNFLLDSAERLGISRQSILRGGLKIYTTVSPKVQNAVNDVFWSGNYNSDFPAPVNGKPVDGAAIFADPSTGAVLGAAGSRQTDYYQGGLDRVFSYSSPGSSIKPIMEYAPAIATGKWTLSSILDNAPHDFGGGYFPQNDSPGMPSKVTLQYALEQSQNVASVWLLQQIGIQTGAQFAENDGIQLTAADKQHLSIAIGGMEKGVTPWQMVQAYEPFDDGGQQQVLHVINRVVNVNGQTIYSFTPATHTIMSPQVASTMTELMQDVVLYGTGTYAQIPGWGVAGKTGTVQWDSGLTGSHPSWISRAWWDGYTPNMVGSVYLGYDNPYDSTYHLDWNTAPNHYCELIWKQIVEESEQGVSPQQFSVAPSPTSASKPTPQPKPVQPTINNPSPSSSGPVVEGLTASWDPVGNGVVLNWINGSSTATNFLISRDVGVVGTASTSTGTGDAGGSTGSTSSLTLLSQTTQNSYEDTTVQPGLTYTYSIQATDQSGNLIGSPVVTSITIPGTPAATASTGTYSSTPGPASGTGTGTGLGLGLGTASGATSGTTTSSGSGSNPGTTTGTQPSSPTVPDKGHHNVVGSVY